MKFSLTYFLVCQFVTLRGFSPIDKQKVDPSIKFCVLVLLFMIPEATDIEFVLQYNLVKKSNTSLHKKQI